MKRCIEFRSPVMDWSDMNCVIKIIPEIEKSFVQRKGDYVYNCSDVIDFTIEQIDAISDEYEVRITSSCITIIN